MNQDLTQVVNIEANKVFEAMTIQVQSNQEDHITLETQKDRQKNNQQ